MKKVGKSTIAWILAIICVLCGLAYTPSISGIVFILIGIAALPIKYIQNIWEKNEVVKKCKIAILIVLFIGSCILTPQTEQGKEIAQKNIEKNTVTSVMENDNDNSGEKKTEKETTTVEILERETTDEVPTTIGKITTDTKVAASVFSIETVSTFDSSPYVVVNNNVPYFTDADMTTEAFEIYSDLDSFGRCGAAYANICKEIMPTGERGKIGQVKPSGWHSVKYDNVDGKYLYNRCHLIGYQLAGENANTKNLITGTRYLNIDGMLPFENMVDDYVDETGNHVLYRVTPVFDGDNLVASGVLMEAKSVEDNGEGILFNVYCYNAQPGIDIDYATGNSSLELASQQATTQAVEQTTTQPATTQKITEPETTMAIGSSDASIIVHKTDTGKKYHLASCSYLSNSDHEVTLEQAKSEGLTPCSKCNPPQ